MSFDMTLYPTIRERHRLLSLTTPEFPAQISQIPIVHLPGVIQINNPNTTSMYPSDRGSHVHQLGSNNNDLFHWKGLIREIRPPVFIKGLIRGGMLG